MSESRSGKDTQPIVQWYQRRVYVELNCKAVKHTLTVRDDRINGTLGWFGLRAYRQGSRETEAESVGLKPGRGVECPSRFFVCENNYDV